MELRRDLGPVATTAVVVGSMIGSGIFLGPELAARAFAQRGIEPTMAHIVAVWAFAGVLVLLGAFIFAELAAMLPGSGGQYVYIRRAFGDGPGFLMGWTAFLVSKTASGSAVAVGFATVLATRVEMGSWAIKGLAVGLIVAVTAINYVGVRFGGWFQTVTTALKAVALLALAVVALFAFDGGSPVAPLPTSGGGSLVGAFGLALVPALWALDGFYNSTQVAEEVRNPRRTLPLSLLAGVTVVASLYIVANVAYVHVLDAPGMAALTAGGDASEAQESAALITARTAGGSAFGDVILVGILVSMLGTLNAIVLTGPRIHFAMARDGIFFNGLTEVHPRYGTPHTALLAQGVVAILFALSGTFEQLITWVIFTTWIFLGLAGLAVVRLRRREPLLKRPFRVPGYPVVPVLFAVVAFAFVVNLVVEAPLDALIGTLVVASGLPLYVWLTAPRTRVVVFDKA